MITRWIRRKGNDRLLLFFNGWGMDGNTAASLDANTPPGFGRDVLLCYDYTVPGFPDGVADEIASYRERTLVAWSLGVRAAAEACLEGIDRAVAVNGTLTPISADRGIAPEIFRATLEGWSEPNRERFYRRICGGAEQLGRFRAMAPERSVEDQKAELAAIEERILQNPVTDASWQYTHAVIGGRDMIFPPAAQQAAWEGCERTVIADMQHVPFFILDSWEALAGCSR